MPDDTICAAISRHHQDKNFITASPEAIKRRAGRRGRLLPGGSRLVAAIWLGRLCLYGFACRLRDTALDAPPRYYRDAPGDMLR